MGDKGRVFEIAPGDGGAAFLLGLSNNPAQVTDHSHGPAKKYLLRTSEHAHAWRGDDGAIHGTLSLIPVR